MIALAEPVSPNTPRSSSCQEGFLALMPTIRHYACRAFRQWSAEAREDAVAEVVANAYAAYVRLVRRGRRELAFATVLARYAIRQFHSGRRVGSRFTVRDVMSQAAQRRHRFIVERLDHVASPTGEWIEAVVEDTATPVADQAAFRCDFPAWLRRLKPRDRRIAEALSLGHSTSEVAQRFRVSASRVSQLRGTLHHSWHSFHGDARDIAMEASVELVGYKRC